MEKGGVRMNPGALSLERPLLGSFDELISDVKAENRSLEELPGTTQVKTGEAPWLRVLSVCAWLHT